MRSHLAAAAALLAVCAAPSAAAVPEACGGAPIAPDRVITGTFGPEVEGDYVMVPFDVPPGTTQVRVKYCFDQPDQRLPANPAVRPGHTLDLGLYEPRRAGHAVWGEAEFRGWGGSSHPDVQITPQGFTGEAAYAAGPRSNEPGRTTRGFVPGPIPAGEWAAELGVASITAEGDSDGTVAWRVEIELRDDPEFGAQPYVAAPFDATPARREAGWYSGDLHVHAEHSALGDASMRETFDYAFSEAGAGLDFVTLSDYVTSSHFGEVGRHQDRYPGKQIVRSAELITYRGHLNNHASARFVDYRTSAIHVRRPDGALEEIRAPRPASALFADIRAAGGFTQINHPTIFPSAIPMFSSFCRGCPWDYAAAETGYDLVDAIEVATGPAGLKSEPGLGPNPFTPLAIDFYEDALDTGAHIAAIGVSDSHKAGRAAGDLADVTGAPLGMATTVVYAEELSEQGIADAVRAGHTYVKLWGDRGPDLRLEAVGGDGKVLGIMGDTVAGNPTLRARVIGAEPFGGLRDPYELIVFRDRVPVLAVPILQADQTLELPTLGAARYRLQLQRSTSIEALTTPIWVTGA